jgi:poly-beta-hydroxyalkanoate depolymerase
MRLIEWFEHNLIGIVPLRYAGAMRRVYPGFVELAAFMNLGRDLRAQIDLFCHFANGEDEKAEPIRAFYHPFAHPEYRRVLDKHSSAAMDLFEPSDASVVSICTEVAHREELVRE